MNQLVRLVFPSGAFSFVALAVILARPGSSKLYLLADPVFIIASVMGLFFTLRFGASRQFFTVLMLIGLGSSAFVILPADPASMSLLSKFYYCLATALVPLPGGESAVYLIFGELCVLFGWFLCRFWWFFWALFPFFFKILYLLIIFAIMLLTGPFCHWGRQ